VVALPLDLKTNQEAILLYVDVGIRHYGRQNLQPMRFEYNEFCINIRHLGPRPRGRHRTTLACQYPIDTRNRGDEPSFYHGY
jgi:hypothetical protein